MFNLFKIKIPKDNAQEITELESWTVKWIVRDNGYEKILSYFKTFTIKEQAEEFEKQLKECGKFTKAWVRTELYKN